MTASASFDNTSSGDLTEFLRANSDAYEWGVKALRSSNSEGDVSCLLGSIERLAGFAEQFHPGRFADGAIENLAHDVGSTLASTSDSQPSIQPELADQRHRRVLHVASKVSAVGGHTRMIFHWIGHDPDSMHSVALTQGSLDIPNWLSSAIAASGGQLFIAPNECSLYNKAKWLRSVAQRHADLVILHHFGSDVVPTVAFAVADGPPVAVLNQADHAFWLGSSVADVVINLRSPGAEHSFARRYARHNLVLPIPLVDPAEKVSRVAAREQLGIPHDQVVLLTVGRPEKYRPCGNYDFVSTAQKILANHASAHLYVVGESLDGIRRHLRQPLSDRLHFVGPIEDPSVFRAAADIYLESFPFGSNTALLEAALAELPVVPAYAPLFELLVANNDSMKGCLSTPRHEADYIEHAQRLIRDPVARRQEGRTVRQCLLDAHVGEGWRERLSSIYRYTDVLRHSPKRMPVSVAQFADSDLGLCLWHLMSGRTYTQGARRDRLPDHRLHRAYVAKEVGDYTTARQIAWEFVRRESFRPPALRLLASALWGKAARGRRLSVNAVLQRLLTMVRARSARLGRQVSACAKDSR
jgi:hypothetical protein